MNQQISARRQQETNKQLQFQIFEQQEITEALLKSSVFKENQLENVVEQNRQMKRWIEGLEKKLKRKEM